MSKYLYKEIKLVEPKFGSDLTSLIVDLDYLRKKELRGSTPAPIFYQLKSLFHTLESIGSTRIEGNHTTIAEFIENKIGKSKKAPNEETKEIENVEKALNHIDKTIKKGSRIDGEVIRKLQEITVTGLSPSNEGDTTPGEYRTEPIEIAGSTHVPPGDLISTRYYMKELTAFINEPDKPIYNLLKVALTHHRFVWIHPFRNGNGRTVRLITYAQLISAGFNVDVAGRIINPAAIFCIDRKKYYDLLSKADSGNDQDLLAWCEYVLTGLKKEIEKVDKLTNYDYLSKNILLPAIDYSLDKKIINPTETEILKVAIKMRRGFQAHHLAHVFPGKVSSHISRYISRMKDMNMIIPVHARGRKYLINFNDNPLVKAVVKMLDKNDFLPLKNEI